MTEFESAKQAGQDARRLNVPFHANPYQYSGSKLKAQKQAWEQGWHEQDQREKRKPLPPDILARSLEDSAHIELKGGRAAKSVKHMEKKEK